MKFSLFLCDKIHLMCQLYLYNEQFFWLQISSSILSPTISHKCFVTSCYQHIVVPKTDITMHWWKMVLMCKNWSLWSQVKSYLNRLMISYSGCKQWYLNFNYIKRWAKKLRFLYNEYIMEIIDNLISSHKLSPMSLPNSFLYISTFDRQFLLQAILS